MASDENKPVDRRRFFRLGLSELLKPLAKSAGPLERMAHELGKMDQPATRPGEPQHVSPNVWLRPPGALPEDQFNETCSRCGDCVRVCPAQAIRLDPSGRDGNGTPFIDANVSSCVVCTGLQCMSACPTGALKPTSVNDIDMGTAVWQAKTCVRTKGEDCTICIDHCPLGSAAIVLHHGRVAVQPLGCIGCGVCQRDCPTSPKSIYVIPIAAKTAPR